MSDRASVYSHAPGDVLLAGVVGSTAYGLARDHSDVDRLGVYASPTVDLLRLYPPSKDSLVTHDPSDITLHEVGKFLRLALSVNPTITELLWLPDDLYEVRTPLGESLIALRRDLLSARRVRDAYLGYAHSQFAKLAKRGDSFSSDTKNRTAKHARHMARLVNQGLDLYRTGELSVTVENADWYHEFGDQSPDVWEKWFAERSAAFGAVSSPLPEFPNVPVVDEFLLAVRAALYATDGR